MDVASSSLASLFKLRHMKTLLYSTTFLFCPIMINRFLQQQHQSIIVNRIGNQFKTIRIQMNSSRFSINTQSNINTTPHTPSTPFTNNTSTEPGLQQQHSTKDVMKRKEINSIQTTKTSTIPIRIKNEKRIRLDSTDVIYSRNWWEIPTVIPDYKLIFFTIPKIACTEWKLLFRKMMGLPPRDDAVPYHFYQSPYTNNLTTLLNYTTSEAEYMMNSPDWTKAIFVREPKERILSSFLNKFVEDRFYFRAQCCSRKKIYNKEFRETCEQMLDIKNFSYFLDRTTDCHDWHWQLQADTIDDKWWPAINFVGHMSNIAQDSKRLLESLTYKNSNIHNAWEKFGKTGWGTNGTQAFLQVNAADHSTDAHAKLKVYYSAENEQFVEKHWAKDWNMLPNYQFQSFHLYNNSNIYSIDGKQKKRQRNKGTFRGEVGRLRGKSDGSKKDLF